MGRWRDLAVAAWSTLLALLLLGPALGHGYVLTYDMVWVPDLSLGADAAGTGSGLPRAVPSDAWVAVLDEVLPGMLLQKLALLGALVPGALGAARLVGGEALPARLVAATVWTWNPFVVERLLIGHWPLLVGYAGLPWVLLAAARWRREGRLPVSLLALLPVASLSASAGLVTAVALLAGVATRSGARWLAAAGLLLAANAPWLVSGLLHAGQAMASGGAFDVFGPGREGGQPAPVAALSLGGIWNADVVPDSRTGWQGWAYLGVLAVLVGLGAWSWWRRPGAADRRGRAALLACWLVGYGIVLLTWALPGPLDRVAGVLPGAALLRDGSRTLALCVPLLAVLAGVGAATLTGAVSRRLPGGGRVSAVAVASCLVLWPLALLPDAAWGGAGRLDAVDYPEALLATSATAASARARGSTLVLPFSAYRAPRWNGGRTVLDPLPRLLAGPVVSSDVLLVDGVAVPGEDPRARQAEEALDGGSAAARSRGLAAAGVGLVVVDHAAPGEAPGVSGGPVSPAAGGDPAVTTVRRIPDPQVTPPPAAWVLAMGAAWAAFVGLALSAPAVWLRRRPQESLPLPSGC